MMRLRVARRGGEARRLSAAARTTRPPYLVFLSCLTLALRAFFFFFWLIWRRIFMRDCFDLALGIPSFL